MVDEIGLKSISSKRFSQLFLQSSPKKIRIIISATLTLQVRLSCGKRASISLVVIYLGRFLFLLFPRYQIPALSSCGLGLAAGAHLSPVRYSQNSGAQERTWNEQVQKTLHLVSHQ